jgi:hypothetical protein
MKAERARLVRLQRLERVRAIAKQAAAQESAAAEGTLAQLEALAERTRQLAADYAGRSEMQDAASLRQVGLFTEGLRSIYERTASDAAMAKRVADAKMAELATAERRRAIVEEHATKKARDIANRSEPPSLGARKGFGTGLE